MLGLWSRIIQAKASRLIAPICLLCIATLIFAESSFKYSKLSNHSLESINISDLWIIDPREKESGAFSELSPKILSRIALIPGIEIKEPKLFSLSEEKKVEVHSCKEGANLVPITLAEISDKRLAKRQIERITSYKVLTSKELSRKIRNFALKENPEFMRLFISNLFVMTAVSIGILCTWLSLFSSFSKECIRFQNFGISTWFINSLLLVPSVIVITFLSAILLPYFLFFKLPLLGLIKVILLLQICAMIASFCVLRCSKSMVIE